MAETDTVNEFMEQLINSALELEAEWADLSVMSRSKLNDENCAICRVYLGNLSHHQRLRLKTH